MSSGRILVWDLPTRLFHWTLVLLVALQYGSGKFGWFDLQWHAYAGYATLTLLVFRVAWGCVGSDSARFAHFMRGPGSVIAYLRGHRGNDPTHNPLGGWSTVLMLALLLAITLAGLASSDDIDTFGPLAAHLDDATVRTATRWHHRLTDLLPWIIGLHVVAVLAHEGRGERLVAAMLHGQRSLDAVPPRIVSMRRAVAVFGLSAAFVYALLRWAGA